MVNFRWPPLAKVSLLLILLTLLGLFLLGAMKTTGLAIVTPDPETERVLVVANRNSPTSLRVAQYYMQRRGIPHQHLVTLDLPDSTIIPAFESISYPTYQKQVEQPVRDFLTRHQLTDRIRYMVLTRGIPLRIKDIPYRLASGAPRTQNQSIDSTLAALDYKSTPIEIKDQDYKKMTGEEIFAVLMPNLYWRQTVPFEHSLTGGYLVTRLDGYSEADARALVDRALTPRPHLSGTVLLDPSINDEITGEPQMVDIFDPAVCTPSVIPNCTPLPRAMREAPGADLNNDLRLTAEMFKTTFAQLPVQVATPQSFATGTDLMAYASWGSNDPVFQLDPYRSLTFLPGAIAETFVSTGGRSFFPTSTGQSMVGDLIRGRQGVTGIRAYIDEPELQGIGSPTLLFSRYFGGANFATACYQSMRFVRWRDVILGDPLAKAVVN
jgi:uncharacterized protein (TIGR03790 family)